MLSCVSTEFVFLFHERNNTYVLRMSPDTLPLGERNSQGLWVNIHRYDEPSFFIVDAAQCLEKPVFACSLQLFVPGAAAQCREIWQHQGNRLLVFIFLNCLQL